MLLIEKLRNFFRSLVGKKKISKKSLLHKKRKVHKQKQHIKKIHKQIIKIKARKVKEQYRKKTKVLEKKPKKKTEKIRYGIPKGHRHEAELKVAEKSSDIQGEYVDRHQGKVSLRIREKATEDFVKEKKPKHTFFFKERVKEEGGIKKIEEKKQERPKIKIDLKKQAGVKKILDIIRIGRGKNLIITNLDLILEIINQLGEVRLDYMAEALKLGEKEAEKLANILENNNLIEISYPSFGKPKLKKKVGGRNVEGNS